MNQKTLIALVLGAAFLVGSGVIVYRGRPVMRLDPLRQTTSSTQEGQGTASSTQHIVVENGASPVTSSVAVSAPTPPSSPSKANEYTMVQVQGHATPQDCWAAVGGSVYDLTAWISRHPGGERPIETMCGTDATARFERQHGGSRAAKSALALLKIGTLR